MKDDNSQLTQMVIAELDEVLQRDTDRAALEAQVEDGLQRRQEAVEQAQRCAARASTQSTHHQPP